MSDCSDSEEFYDAEEFTPIRGSKRPSLSSSPSVTETIKLKEKELPSMSKTEPIPSTSSHPTVDTQTSTEEDRAAVKNVVEDRKRFQELRRCMQAEDEEEPPDPSGSVDHSINMEHPFKIRAHDTMSLQSMTSLGRIGRILSGAAESHPNMLECGQGGATPCVAPSISSRAPSSDDPLPVAESQNVLAMCEPDVIASTKANSLKHRAPPLDSTAPRPQPPPRRKKRNKLHGSQTLSTTDGDNLSVCTNDTDDCRFAPTLPTTQYHEVALSSILCGGQSAALPSPASTIESLTREFRASLQLPHTSSDTEPFPEPGPNRSSSSSRSSTVASNRSHKRSSHEDSKDDSRGSTRTHSDSRPTRGSSNSEKSSSLSSHKRSRRRSAGDERPPAAPAAAAGTPAAARLSDLEILEQVTVLNLDTGERMPLSLAEQKIPQCINPLSLHIMRLTSEYIPDEGENTSPDPMPTSSSWRLRFARKLSISTFNLARKSDSKPMKNALSEQSLNVSRNRETDEESESVCTGGADDDAKETKQESVDKQAAAAIRKKTEKFKRFLGSTVKKTVVAAKSLAQEVTHARHKEDVGDIIDDVRGDTNIKLKASNSHKGPYDFDQCVRHVQEMEGHCGAVWCCKFSVCGRLLATAGQDKLLRVWVTRDAEPQLQDMRKKYNAAKKSSPTPSQESLSSPAPPPPPQSSPLRPSAPFCPEPFAVYEGHTSDLLDVSWSKNYFLLSSSMDKTVRLWHISRCECLCCFQHIDFVTAIVFHPRDDRYFLSGSLDGKLRLWNIPDKKVAVWNEVDGKTKLITAANFCQNGKFAVVGIYDGRCIFYTTDNLKYHTQIDVRSTRGKNSTGRKISGIEPMPNDDKILITSNDSRIRLYDLRDLNLSCKYKGYVNVSSQIKASFSHDGKYIVSGSENQCIFIWKTYHDYSKFTSVRRDRNDFWEGIKAHNAVVTCTVFAPNPDHVIKMIAEREQEAKGRDGDKDEEMNASEAMVSSSQTGHVLVSADFNGCIKVFVHKAKPKHSSLPASALA